MSKDDSFLYSGITSASSDKAPTPREVQREAKESARIKLKPAAEVVLAELAKERERVIDLRSIVLDRTTSEGEINTELLARKLYLNYLNSLEAKVNNILKEKV